MIIKSLKIYGFGKLADLEINLTEGINIIEGKNEAGKSTLMAFIRAILFGFASRRNPHERYEPLDGGKFGGILFLTNEKGEKYSIERIFTQKTSGDAVVTLPSGEQGGEELLAKIIGKINETVFRQVFSFGLTELQQIELLNDEQINDFIYHVGTGSVNQILEMKKEIEKKKSNLFLQGGKKPIINQLLVQLDEISDEIRKLEKESDKYTDYQHDVEALKNEIEINEKQIRKLERTLSTKEKYEQIYQPYVALKKVDLALAEYPADLQFPEDGLRRLEDAQSQLNKLKATGRELNERVKLLQGKVIDLSRDETLFTQSSQIKYLQSQLALYVESVKNAQSYEGQIEHINNKVLENRSLIGENYDEAAIKSFVITIQDRDWLQSSYNLLSELKLQIDELAREAERNAELKEETINSINVLKNESEITDEVDILIAEFPGIRHNWAELKEQRMERAHKEEQLSLYNEQLAMPATQAFLGNFLILLFTLVVTGFVYYYSNSFLVTGATALVGLFGIVIYNLVRNMDNKRKNHSGSGNIARLKQQLGRITENEFRLQADLMVALSKLGTTDLSDATIYRLEQNYNFELSKSLMRLGERKRIGEFEKELKDIENRHVRFTENQEKLKKQHSEIASELSHWLESKSLPAALNYNALNSLISTIERLKDLLSSKENLTNELTTIKKFQSDYQANVSQLTDAARLPENKSIEQHITDLSERLTNYNYNFTQNKNSLDRIAEVEIAEKQNAREIESQETVISELILQAQVKDVEEFYVAAGKFKQFSDLQQERKQLMLSIKFTAGSETDYDSLISSLEQVDFDELVTELDTLRSERISLSNLIKERSVKLGELQSALKAMESNTRIAELKNEYEQLRAELRRAGKEWLGYAYSEQLLERTMKLYEEEKQPNILRVASDLFSKMTGGRYTKLVAPIGSDKLRVIRADGKQFEPQYLSRGTVEQLFLAIRYALVEEYSQQYRLPVMLDDVFVNFDEERLGNAVDIITELALEHQVIIFTCHSELTNRLKSADNSVYNTKLA